MKNWVTGIFLLNLVLRLLLIGWYPACYTDSIYYMSALDHGPRGVFILPAYPFTVMMLRKLVHDPVQAGRLISILFGAAAVFPLYELARIVYGRRAALITVSLYTFSPLIFRWSLRIFPHAQFFFFIVVAAACFFRQLDQDNAIWLSAGVFFSGLAALTYPNGLVLFPVCLAAAILFLFHCAIAGRKIKPWLWLGFGGCGAILLLLCFFKISPPPAVGILLQQLLSLFPVRLPGPPSLWPALLLMAIWLAVSLVGVCLPPLKVKSGRWYSRPLNLILLLMSFSSWGFFYIWQKYLAQSYWYQKGMESSYRSLSSRWPDWLSHYLYSYPYVVTYPVAAFALLGLLLTVSKARKSICSRLWLSFYLYFLTAVTFVLVVNKWWTPRYQYDLVPFALMLAGAGLDFLISRPRLKWLGAVCLSICLAGSLVFTLFVLYWSRASFADISRSSLFLKENYPGRNIYTDETLKVGFWARRPLRGYTSGSRSGLQLGDIVVLHGWHSNLKEEYAFLQRNYDVEITHRERAVIAPLLADDIVDWAGKLLPRRANAPVVWEQRFRKQDFESWIMEIRGRKEGGAKAPVASRVEGASINPLLTTRTEKAHYFDVGVWEILTPVEPGERVRVDIAHARGGVEGSFWMEVYTDSDGDDLPDTLVAQSPRLESAAPGQWSGWEFISPGGKLFVGSRWDLGNWVYCASPPWPDKLLGEVMYYSRGGIPKNIAHRVSNLRISFPGRGVLPRPSPGSLWSGKTE